MINVILDGRLGNNLFQYALGEHLAIKNKTSLRLITFKCLINTNFNFMNRMYELKSFAIDHVLFSNMPHYAIINRLCSTVPFFKSKIYCETDWRFNPDVLKLNGGVCLNGYFQSEKYFKDIEHIIRSKLRFKRDTFGEQGIIYKDQILNCNSVGLHVRRGDYLSSSLHNVCNMKYYSKSIAYIQDQIASPYFFIFSDDIEWCRENFHIPHCIFVNIHAAKKNPIIDFQLMSLCKHNIISNSSFSWWAAWLNGNREKLVVAPNRWFNDERKNDQAMRDTIPADWVRMPF